MKISEEEALRVIARLITEEKGSDATATLIKPTANIYISSSENVSLKPFNVVISCTPEPLPSTMLQNAKIKHYLHLKCQAGKLGSRDLRTELPKLPDFFASFTSPFSGTILVCCPTGKDLSVGTALALLCLYADEEGEADASKRKNSGDMGKSFIKQRLSWITVSNPALNPSRATLQSVNAALLESRAPKENLQRGTNSPISECVLGTREPRLLTQESEPEQGLQVKGNSGNIKDGPPKTSSTIFSLLQTSNGRPWTFVRTLCSKIGTQPSGTVTGTASFTRCMLPLSSPPTLLYAEEGEFITDTGLRFTARRRYVYQFKTLPEDMKGYIAVHFFNDEKMPRSVVADGVGEKGEGIGGLFVEMGDVDVKEDIMEAMNKEQHLCAEDVYGASWKFSKAMACPTHEGEAYWEVRYDVKGPKKDYVSSTRYTRS